MMVSIGGLFVALFFTGIIGAIAWWQWNSYVTLDQRVEAMDASLLDSAGTRIEKVLDAPQGSVIVPFVPATMVQSEPYGQVSHQEVVGSATDGAQQNQ